MQNLDTNVHWLHLAVDNDKPAKKTEDINLESASPKVLHHPRLIGQLENDHERLIELYGMLKSAVAASRMSDLNGLLTQFSSVLRGHIMAENMKLYIFLSYHLADRPEQVARVKKMRRAKKALANQVTSMRQQFADQHMDETLLSSFASQLADIGLNLGERVKEEDAFLYPLYDSLAT